MSISYCISYFPKCNEKLSSVSALKEMKKNKFYNSSRIESILKVYENGKVDADLDSKAIKLKKEEDLYNLLVKNILLSVVFENNELEIFYTSANAGFNPCVMLYISVNKFNSLKKVRQQHYRDMFQKIAIDINASFIAITLGSSIVEDFIEIDGQRYIDYSPVCELWIKEEVWLLSEKTKKIFKKIENNFKIYSFHIE